MKESLIKWFWYTVCELTLIAITLIILEQVFKFCRKLFHFIFYEAFCFIFRFLLLLALVFYLHCNRRISRKIHSKNVKFKYFLKFKHLLLNYEQNLLTMCVIISDYNFRIYCFRCFSGCIWDLSVLKSFS